MSGSKNGNYYAVIPADVRYDQELNANAKLLYGELTSLCNQQGYCWAKNDYFAQLYGLSERTISRLISQLEGKGYIRSEIVPTKGGTERRIYAGLFLVRQEDGEGDGQNCPEGGSQKCLGGVDKNVQPPLDKNVYQNNKQENNKQNIPPVVPQGTAVEAEPKKKPPRRGGKSKTVPAYRPDWFERFWALYPRRTNRVAAVRAWDKLKPDFELCKVMKVAILAQTQTEQWREGRIPHPSTWLNGARWLDEVSIPAGDSPGGWASDPEVY